MTLEQQIEAIAERKAQEMAQPLLERIAHLESLQDEWVSVKEAEKRTGKDRKTLLRDANRKGSFLKTKIEGKRSRKYSANSIVNYNNRKTLSRDPESHLRLAS